MIRGYSFVAFLFYFNWFKFCTDIDLGIAENTKQLISDMVQSRINQLNKEEQNRLQKIIQALEMKDFYTVQSKVKK